VTLPEFCCNFSHDGKNLWTIRQTVDGTEAGNVSACPCWKQYWEHVQHSRHIRGKTRSSMSYLRTHRSHRLSAPAAFYTHGVATCGPWWGSACRYPILISSRPQQGPLRRYSNAIPCPKTCRNSLRAKCSPERRMLVCVLEANDMKHPSGWCLISEGCLRISKQGVCLFCLCDLIDLI